MSAFDITVKQNPSMNLKYRILIVVLIACLVPALITPPLYSQEDFLPALVKDISDRAYEPAVIKLLDGAKEFINARKKLAEKEK